MVSNGLFVYTRYPFRCAAGLMRLQTAALRCGFICWSGFCVCPVQPYGQAKHVINICASTLQHLQCMQSNANNRKHTHRHTHIMPSYRCHMRHFCLPSYRSNLTCVVVCVCECMFESVETRDGSQLWIYWMVASISAVKLPIIFVHFCGTVYSRTCVEQINPFSWRHISFPAILFFLFKNDINYIVSEIYRSQPYNLAYFEVV